METGLGEHWISRLHKKGVGCFFKAFTVVSGNHILDGKIFRNSFVFNSQFWSVGAWLEYNPNIKFTVIFHAAFKSALWCYKKRFLISAQNITNTHPANPYSTCELLNQRQCVQWLRYVYLCKTLATYYCAYTDEIFFLFKLISLLWEESCAFFRVTVVRCRWFVWYEHKARQKLG